MRIVTVLSLALLALPAAAQNPRFQSGEVRWNGKAAPRSDAALRAEMITAHNAARADYGVGPLSWNDALAADAALWAKALAVTQKFDHDPAERTPPQGENLFKGTRGAFAYAAMAKLWVDEKQWFKKGRFPEVVTEGHWSRVGHYTQIVWPSTREFGCALASNAAEDFLVCRYLPAGNYFGVELK